MPWSGMSCCEPLKRGNETGSRHTVHNLKVDCTRSQTRENTAPTLNSATFELNLERPKEVDANVLERPRRRRDLFT